MQREEKHNPFLHILGGVIATAIVGSVTAWLFPQQRSTPPVPQPVGRADAELLQNIQKLQRSHKEWQERMKEESARSEANTDITIERIKDELRKRDDLRAYPETRVAC
jgi:gas vesicle protein